jgi:hypothetical protein
MECKTALYLSPASHDCLAGVIRAKKTGQKLDSPTMPLKGIRLHVPPNCVVVFKKQFVHAGADYRHDNIRLHLYLHCAVQGSQASMTEDVYTLHWILGRLGARADQGRYFQSRD